MSTLHEKVRDALWSMQGDRPTDHVVEQVVLLLQRGAPAVIDTPPACGCGRGGAVTYSDEEARACVGPCAHASHEYIPGKGFIGTPRDSATRKGQPIATGVLAYWPKTMAALSEVSRRGNDKHNPGEPLHWAREKSTDEADCCVRHIVDALEADARGEPGGVMALNEDGSPHLLSALWRLNSWCERVLCGDERWRTVAKASAPAERAP